MKQNRAYNGYIKDVWLELPNYLFEPQNLETLIEDKWVKRGEAEAKFKSFFAHSSENGAYLVTGFRGMGKSSFVKKCLRDLRSDYKQSNAHYDEIVEMNISFGQKGVRDIDVLRQIIKELRNNITSKRVVDSYELFSSYGMLGFLTSVVFFLLLAIQFHLGLVDLESMKFESILPLIIIGMGVSVILVAAVLMAVRKINPQIKSYIRLNDLYGRCVSQITREESSSTNLGEKIPFGTQSKTVKSYPIANTKEIENEIIDILEHVHGRKKFVFVFDEIDKLDPDYDNEYIHQTLTDFERTKHADISHHRDRRRVAMGIMANLKYLITTAKAKFIFIAGREMFDASLADISDRQSSISSIFHQVLNVDSFLKSDSVDSDDDDPSRLTKLIEKYLERMLLKGVEMECSKKTFLEKYRECLDNGDHSVNKMAVPKIIFLLSDFISFLTYRSNGSPKKIVRMIQDMVEVRAAGEIYRCVESGTNGQICISEDDKNIFAFKAAPIGQKANKFFIHFGYYTQYKIGFIGHIFASFSASYGNFAKSYNEKILVSTPFLLDHIIKFHPFAFSLQNLELAPEVLSENRSPELRNFIEYLVSFLSASHIRETEMGLFDYKFLNKTFHEITYIGKIFEEESAAFNFSLDEGFSIKLHLRNKIKELRSIYKEFQSTENKSYIRSISFLNELLGDAHFFDQDYDESMVCYLDALQTLESNVKGGGQVFELESFITYIHIKMKLGLTYEKIDMAKRALAVYSELNQFSKHYISNCQTKITSLASSSDLLQVVIQPILAEIFAIEKVSVHGVDYRKILKVCSAFEDIKNVVSASESDGVQINGTIIRSKLYQNIGTLLYFKNDISFDRSSAFDSREFKYIVNYYYYLDNAKHVDYRVSMSSYSYLKKSLQIALGLQEDSINIMRLLFKVEKILNSFKSTTELNYGERSTAASGRITREEKPCNEDKEYLKNIAVTLNKIADCMFACLLPSSESEQNDNKSNREEKISIKSDFIFWEAQTNVQFFSFIDFAKYFEAQFEEGEGLSQPSLNNDIFFQLIICVYHLGANVFQRSGKNLACSFLYRKILLAFSLVASRETIVKARSFLEKLFLHILKIASYNSSASDRHQISKIIQSFETPDSSELFRYALMSISTNPEVKEAVFIYGELILKSQHGTNQDGKKAKQVDFEKLSSLVTQYNVVSTQNANYHELRFQAHLNSLNLRKKELNPFISNLIPHGDLWTNVNKLSKTMPQAEGEIKTVLNHYVLNQADVTVFLDDLEYCVGLVANTIWCYYQIVRIYNDFGVNYHMSYSSLGDYHRRLGDYMVTYKLCKVLHLELINLKVKGVTSEHHSIEFLLNGLLGYDVVNSIDFESEYQLALQNYSLARQLHTEGKPYERQISNMYFLEDDYNDSLYNFGIAVERQRINSARFRHHINSLSKIINASHMYQVATFFGGAGISPNQPTFADKTNN